MFKNTIGISFPSQPNQNHEKVRFSLLLKMLGLLRAINAMKGLCTSNSFKKKQLETQQALATNLGIMMIINDTI